MGKALLCMILLVDVAGADRSRAAGAQRSALTTMHLMTEPVTKEHSPSFLLTGADSWNILGWILSQAGHGEKLAPGGDDENLPWLKNADIGPGLWGNLWEDLKDATIEPVVQEFAGGKVIVGMRFRLETFPKCTKAYATMANLVIHMQNVFKGRRNVQ